MNSNETLKRTPLHALHLELGARMVPFAGYEMPVQYPAGIKAEHAQTRQRAGLFDISHMGQVRVTGDGAAQALETLVPGEIGGLGIWRQRYTVLTNEQGGVIDDLMITRLPEYFLLVVNAACKERDFRHLRSSLEPGCRVEMPPQRALLALQGPAAAAVMARLNGAITDLRFMSGGEFSLSGYDCLVHRCGYTGEDGFEISLAAAAAEPLARILLDQPEVAPAGLGARDSLRLEAGLCLYGHELDESTTPVEAGLAWTIAAKYRDGRAPARFPGGALILAQLQEGPGRTLAGFRPEGRVPVRDGAVIFDKDGRKTGIITSGGYGPTVEAPVAMGYVDARAGDETDFTVEIRGRRHGVTRVPLPFVAHRYHR